MAFPKLKPWQVILIIIAVIVAAIALVFIILGTKSVVCDPVHEPLTNQPPIYDPVHQP